MARSYWPSSAVDVAPVVEGQRGFRVQADGLIVVLDGAVALGHGGVGDAAAVEGVGHLRVQPDGLLVVLERAVGVGLFAPGLATVVVGLGEVRFQTQRLVVVLDGAVELAKCCVGDPTIDEDAAAMGSEPQRLVVILDGALGLALVDVGVAATAQAIAPGVSRLASMTAVQPAIHWSLVKALSLFRHHAHCCFRSCAPAGLASDKIASTTQSL